MSKQEPMYVADLKKSEDGVTEMSDSVLVSATYDGGRKVAVLKFYDPEGQKIHLWYDDTGHKPYCFVKSNRVSDADLNAIKERDDVVAVEKVEKQDLLNDHPAELYKIVATDPLAIGGSARASIRDLVEAWEADIKYYENYLYDKGFPVGAFYRIDKSKVIPIQYGLPIAVQKGLEKTLQESDPAFKKSIEDWAWLLSQPLPDLRRVALDIEVIPAEENRIPDAQEAAQQVIAVSLVGSDDLKEVLVLKRKGVAEGRRTLADKNFEVRFFDNERDLLEVVFERIVHYPFILTFNGDDFDLNYLYHRAQRPEIGFSKDEVPISLGNNVAYVRPGVHIDLYKTFINRSVQVYAFNNRYSEHTLDGVASSLLGEGKIHLDAPIGELSLYEIGEYCYQDSKITLQLTSFDDNLLMKLLLVISRVAKMPIDDVARIAVSNWIRSMMYFEHRRRNALIPRRSDLEAREQAVVSEPIIKGKKYKGGIVVEPTKGVYFDVSVVDFASLYPSLIKVYNLSYETVRCIHDECRSNKIPGTSHWVCKKQRGITSTVIGSLRDIRVNYYKPLSKRKDLRPDDKALANVVSQALKVILNASYGVMGAEIYPLYYLPAADATAALGRYAITQTIEKSRDLGITVVYGDTDSLFLKSPGDEKIKDVTQWADKTLGIELDLDKVYRYVAFSQRKKNYLGVLPDGNVDIKGLTGKKSHTPPFIRNAFYDSVEILSRVKTESDFEHAREEIKTQLRKKYLALKNKEIPIEELAFNVMMSKSPKSYIKTKPQHVKAAELLMKQGKEVKAGDIIAFVKTTNSVGVKPVSMANVSEIDTKKYEDYMRGTFDQILDALGYDFEEIVGATKLEDFFWSS